MSVLHRQPENAQSAPLDETGGTGTASTPSLPSSRACCPECNKHFQPVHVRQLFCSPEHKTAFHNRATVRGRALTPLAIASRITRDGCAGDKETGKRARRESRQLMDAWAREDREAGRMNMVGYMRERWRIGY